MLFSFNHCQDITVHENKKLKSPLLPFKELDIGNGDLSTNSKYDNCSNINFPHHHAFNQVDLNTNLLDKAILTKVVLQPTKKPRSVGPHKSILKKNCNKRKSRLGNKKFRSVGKPLYWIHANPNSNNGLKSPQHLLYKSKDKKKCPFRKTSTMIPIVGWKITKKRSHIINNISIPGCLPHCRFNHKFKLNTDLPSMSNKDTQLLYSLIDRLLFTIEL